MATSSKAKKKTVRLASGRKRVRQDVKLNAANTALRSKFRTVIKNVQKAVLTGDKAKATESVQVGAERHRFDRRQGPVPQEQGRAPQEPPVGQAEGVVGLTQRPDGRLHQEPASQALFHLSSTSAARGPSMNAPDPAVVSPMPHVMNTYGRLPIALSHGRGCWVWDTEGRKYLDGLGGIAVNTLGHAHPKLVPALQEQIGQADPQLQLLPGAAAGAAGRQAVRALGPDATCSSAAPGWRPTRRR